MSDLSGSSVCPECGSSVMLKTDTVPHEIVQCEECGSELEVKSVSPKITLEMAPPVKEDWGE